jgi:hypothetical protein
MNFLEATTLLNQRKLIKHEKVGIYYKYKDKGIYDLATFDVAPIIPDLVNDNGWEEVTTEEILKCKNETINKSIDLIDECLAKCVDENNFHAKKIKDQINIIKQLQEII